MELRQLAYFLAVADQGGFTAAADQLPVTQPALSLSVRQLERELGTELFVRLGRGVALTSAGAALIGPARRALRDAEAGRTAVARVIGLETGLLSLCCLPTFAQDPLSPLIGAFRSSYPGVVVELPAPEDSEELVSLIVGGRYELGIGEHLEEFEAQGLRQHHLGEQQMVVILPPGTDHQDRSPYPLARLKEVPIVTTPPGTSIRRLLDEGLRQEGVETEIAVVTAQREAVVPLVAAGAGAALVPESLAETGRPLGALIGCPDPPIVRRTVLVQRDDPLTPAAERFVELALSSSASRLADH